MRILTDNSSSHMVILMAVMLLAIMALWSKSQAPVNYVGAQNAIPQALANPNENAPKNIAVITDSTIANEFRAAHKSMQQAVAKHMVIGEATAEVMGMGNENLSQAEKRRIMRAAGIKVAEPAKTKNAKHVDFAEGLAKEIIANEIEDFADKMQLVGKVGRYVADNVRE